jgi:rhomboid family GlyGly-CTERM serine protease
MGLHQGDLSHLNNRLLAGWPLPLAVACVAAVLAVFGDSSREWLSFDRSALRAGELWRLFSGHFVHLGPSHLLLNLAGLLLIWYLVGDSYTRRQWLFVAIVVILGVDAGLWVWEPNLTWYVGLSGLLHGLLAAGVVVQVRSGRPEIWILAAGLAAKLVYEQISGPLPGSEASSGGTVIVAAHVYGACGGVLAALMISIRVSGRASI